MNILQTLKQLRDDLKSWVTVNLNAINAKIDENTIPIDDELDSDSTNPVQNKAIANAINNIPIFSGDYNDLTNAPNIAEDESGDMMITDDAGNIIFKADADGIHTTSLSLDGQDVTEIINDTVAALVDSAPDTLNTLNELANALGDDPNFATTVAAEIGKKVDKVDGMGLSANDYTDAEKTKLGAIEEGAEANQNTFSNVKVGDTTITANDKTDTLNLEAGNNITITPDVDNDKITIAANYTNEELGQGYGEYTFPSYGSTGGTLLTVALDNYTLITGGIVVIKFTGSSWSSVGVGADATLNINNTGDIPIYYRGSAITANVIKVGDTATFMYDGTNYHVISIDNERSNLSLGQGYGTCTVWGITSSLSVTLSGYILTTGGIVAVKFSGAVKADSTLNINSTGAKPIYYRGTAITDNVIRALDTATFMYDGTNYHLISIDRSDEYTAEDLGLGNVDNTSDMDKPVSTATQTALNDLKSELSESIVSESDEWKVVDDNGNVIFAVGADGAHTTSLTLNGVPAITESELEELASDVAYISVEDNETVMDPSSLEKIDIQLNEPAPIETVSSICDFTLTPTTMQAGYGLTHSNVISGSLRGKEIPLLTTKGILSVKDKNGILKYSKQIEPLINKRGISDSLTEKEIYKIWSKKFYLNKLPVSKVLHDYSNVTWTWEFTEEDFAQTGIPAKLSDISMASSCFYNEDDSQTYLEKRVYGGAPYPAKFSYDADSKKYILIARGVGDTIESQLTIYSKVYFYYQLDIPYTISNDFAMGISAEDIVSFDPDFTDVQEAIDLQMFQTGGNSKYVTEFNIDPTVTISIPRNNDDAFDGMINAARLLNITKETANNETSLNYNWIGEGDGTTDYTALIQTELNNIHFLTNGGVVYLGPGTYPINGSLNVYENTTIIGCGPKTIINQTADNTNVIILSGSNITLKDFTINLAGACTELTACVYANSENDTGENGYPKNYYVANLTMDNILMTGKYRFDYVNGAGVVSEAYNNYKGIGIYGRSYFNYAHVDNVHGRYLMCVTYGSGGGNYFNITSEFCKYGVYDGGVNNTFFINGHSYYEKNESGKYISMSDGIVHDIRGHQNIYNISVYDTQHLSYLIYFGGQTQGNTYTLNTNCAVSDNSNKINTDKTGTRLEYKILDFGRGNVGTNYYKNIPFSIGNVAKQISGQTTQVISDHVVLNALSGAGVWGNITSNVAFTDRSEDGLNLSDICRYPSERTGSEAYFNTPSTISTVGASENAPIEIEIDIRNRPLYGQLGYFIQFDHRYVASDFTVYYDVYNNGQYDVSYDVKNNVDVVPYLIQHQNAPYNIYRIKFSFTKPLQIENFTYEDSGYGTHTINYNPDGLIGICNIGMTINDYAGRSFLGECGGSLYGNVDMHQNTLKNLPTPQEDGDAVSKAYLEERLSALLAQINGN